MDKEKAQTRLYNQAIHLIAHKGISALEIRVLAREANTSVERFYAYFRCRDNLLLQIFDDGWRLMKECVGVEVLKTGISPLQKLVAIVRGILRAFNENPELVQSTVIIGMVSTGWELRNQLRATKNYTAFFEALKEYRNQLRPFLGDEESAEVFEEMIFGMLTRFVFLMSPVSGRSKQWNTKRRQDKFLKIVERQMEGIIKTSLSPDKTQ
jgi:AcrR family transcriptional regulator